MPKGSRRGVLPVSRERFQELLNFDRETGVFSWRADRQGGRGIRRGHRAGSVDPNGYRYIRVDGHDFLSQRLAWFWEYGEWPGDKIIRFRDGNKDNCAISNLRDASYVEDGKFDWRTKEGRSAQQKAYRATIQDQIRDANLRLKFGLSLAQYEQMREAQNHACAICGKPETVERNGKPRWLAVDHCHHTGKVRGLLCGRCNPMIGYAADDAELLRKAADYVARHNGT